MSERASRGGKFLPAFFVEPVALGETFERGQWPLHMSYFPPIETAFKLYLANRMREYINPMEPFMVEVGDDALFGPNNDLPVKRMVETKELIAVHRALVAILQYLPHSAEFRTPLRPHVTSKPNGLQLNTGDTIEVGGFSIVETSQFSPNWQVIGKIGLKGADMLTDARIIKKETE